MVVVMMLVDGTGCGWLVIGGYWWFIAVVIMMLDGSGYDGSGC